MLSLVVLKLGCLSLSEMSLVVPRPRWAQQTDRCSRCRARQSARRAEAGEAGTGWSRSESHFFIYTEAWLAFIPVSFVKWGQAEGEWVGFSPHVWVNVHQAGRLNEVEEMQRS